MLRGEELAHEVRLAAKGDATAQTRLVAALTPLARATAQRLVDDHDSVDDVVQEAFIEVFAAAARLRHPEAFPAWVRLAVRKHAERHRRRLPRTVPLLEGAGPASVGADEAAQERALALAVHAALSTLRDGDRRLLELRYLADWSVADLAAVLQITEGAVRKRLHDARRRLRPAVEPLHRREDRDMTDYEGLLGRVYAPGELELDEAPPLARPAVREPIATGLKIIDSMAPIARGGTVELVGPAGTGHLVVTVELGYRLHRTEHEAAIVAVASARQSFGAWSNLAKLVTDLPEHDRHAVILSEDEGGARRALQDGRGLAAGLAAGGVDVLLVVDTATTAAVGGPAPLRELAGVSSGGGSVTVILLDPYERGTALPPSAGMDTRLVLTLEHLTLGIFPALDPVESHATFDESPVAADVRRLLRASMDVRRFFDQPMIVAEDHTGDPPTWVDRADAEASLQDLLGARS